MGYSSEVFLFAFFPSFLLIFLVLVSASRFLAVRPRSVVLNGFLLFSSVLFYVYGEKQLWWALAFSVSVTFFGGIVISDRARSYSKWVLWVFVFLNVTILFYYKYSFFIVGLVGFSGMGWSYASGVLPLGLSFFVFQNISYLVDVYRGDVPCERSFLKYSAYITFFPQLIAGPIVRYRNVRRFFDWSFYRTQDVGEGAVRFCFGVAKKVLIADRCAPFVDDAFAMEASALSPLVCWYAVFCYSIQILFDFSAYSDMAIGIGKMVGIKIPENFDRPYAATSFRDFWRRWHISLSTWFRDYVYIPLGGSRQGWAREFGALIIVFLLCGLWHGANLTFLFWGGIHGVLICFSKIPDKYFPLFVRKLWFLFGSHIVFLLVVLLWVPFRSNSIGEAFAWYRTLSIWGAADGVAYVPMSLLNREVFAAVLIGFLVARFDFSKVILKLRCQRAIAYIRAPYAFLLLGLSGFYLLGTSYNPFIYFRF